MPLVVFPCLRFFFPVTRPAGLLGWSEKSEEDEKMKKPVGTFWLLVIALILGVVFSDCPLLAKGHGNSKGGEKKRNQKSNKNHGKPEKQENQGMKQGYKQEYEHGENREKFRKVVPPGHARVYSPPPAGSIQKDARKYRYIYYPDIEMYYNRDTDRYFWLQGEKWTSAQAMPEWARVKYLPRIELDEYYMTPYADHPWVGQSFPNGPEVAGVVKDSGRVKGPPSHAPAWGYRRKYNYNYYPQTNVYYNVETKRYFWVDGGNWRFGIEIPSGVILDQGTMSKVVLGSPYPY